MSEADFLRDPLVPLLSEEVCVTVCNLVDPLSFYLAAMLVTPTGVTSMVYTKKMKALSH